MFTLGLHTGHDSGAALFKDQELVAFCKEERMTRIKNDGGKFKLHSIDAVLETAGITRHDIDTVALSRTKLPLSTYRKTKRGLRDNVKKILKTETDRFLVSEMWAQNEFDDAAIIDFDKLRTALKVRENTEIVFCNHHYAHILGAFRFTEWQEKALFLSCDGTGDNAFFSAYYYHNGQLENLQGDHRNWHRLKQNAGASIGLAYAYATELLGFTPNRHEGKLTGLAAFGKPLAAEKLVSKFAISTEGAITTPFATHLELRNYVFNTLSELSREDAAASIQNASEQVILKWASQFLSLRDVDYIGLSGGVFANVKINQVIAELPRVKEVFIFPAMGDEGLPVGNAVDALIRQYGLQNLTRRKLDHVYFGYPYSGEELLAKADSLLTRVTRTEKAAKITASLLAEGKVGAIFCRGMEMGPRALGARTILASPAKREVNDSINKRLERTEFMPFAPYVLAEDADTVFEIDDSNRHACEFMTITTKVKPDFVDVIPAAVHIDGTARPQIVSREQNTLYYDILEHFKALTGIPCLVNTSFNAHEEPIINTPEEALKALYDNRVDFLVCEQGIIERI